MNGMTMDERWIKIRDVIHNSAVETLGYEKQNQGWFDENDTHIPELINKKLETLQDMQANPRSSSHKEAFNRSKSECQRQILKVQNDWWTARATEMQSCADRVDLRAFYEGIKNLYGTLQRHTR